MGGKIDHSVIGLLSKSFSIVHWNLDLNSEPPTLFFLVKAENEKAELRMSEEEVMAQVRRFVKSSSLQHLIVLQMKVLILAGYETTSSAYVCYVSTTPTNIILGS